MYLIERNQFLPINLEKAWGFFSNPDNLSKITPDSMSFQIVSSTSAGKIRNNDVIDYMLTPIAFLPLRWKTLISKVDEPNCFTDTQLKGPYKLWEHTHTFTETKGGVLMQDHVKYILPFGIIGKLFHPVVKKRLDYIFDYRYNKLNQLFNEGVLL
jgi:ligand-binding SRPBCC domain-containing protein